MYVHVSFLTYSLISVSCHIVCRPEELKGFRCGHPFKPDDPHDVCLKCRTIPMFTHPRYQACQVLKVDLPKGDSTFEPALDEPCNLCAQATVAQRLNWQVQSKSYQGDYLTMLIHRFWTHNQQPATCIYKVQQEPVPSINII